MSNLPLNTARISIRPSCAASSEAARPPLVQNLRTQPPAPPITSATMPPAFTTPAPVARRRSGVALQATCGPQTARMSAPAPRPRAAKANATDAVRGTLAAAAAAGLLALSPALAGAPPDLLFVDETSVVPKAAATLATKALSSVKTSTGYTVHFIIPQYVPYGQTPADYAQKLFDEWGSGADDVVIVGGTKVARAGVVCGENAAKLVTKEIAESLGNETYAVRAGQEAYAGAVLDVNNRLVAVLSGETDPGPPKMGSTEVVGKFKTKAETDAQRGKYIKVVGALLVIAFVAPFVQTAWFLK